jgi:hypothetical protein
MKKKEDHCNTDSNNKLINLAEKSLTKSEKYKLIKDKEDIIFNEKYNEKIIQLINDNNNNNNNLN